MILQSLCIATGNIGKIQSCSFKERPCHSTLELCDPCMDYPDQFPALSVQTPPEFQKLGNVVCTCFGFQRNKPPPAISEGQKRRARDVFFANPQLLKIQGGRTSQWYEIDQRYPRTY